MPNLFEGISISGIVKPGEIYVLFDTCSGNVGDEIDLIYLIRSERELLKTLRMDMQIVLASMFPIRKLVSLEETDEDRYEFEFLVGTGEKDLSNHTLVLHRMKPFSEMKIKMKDIFGQRDEKKPAKGRASLPVAP